MDKELEKIRKRSTEILGDYPEKRAELVARLAEAEKTETVAKNALESSVDLDSYDKAMEVVKRAELGKKFVNDALRKLDEHPRMDADEYQKAVNTCKKIMDNAVDTYRTKAADLMDQLKKLRDDYLQTAEDTNNTLMQLDAAANVLQTRHPYKAAHFTGRPDVALRDKKAWIAHAVRYDAYTAGRLATTCSEDDKEEGPYIDHDSLLVAAWYAVEKGYPRKSY